MLDAYIYEGLRTPFGRHAGALAKVRPDDLLADVIRNLLKSSAFKPEQTFPQSDPRREIAAYRIDRLLRINHVAPAKAIAIPEGSKPFE